MLILEDKPETSKEASKGTFKGANTEDYWRQKKSCERGEVVELRDVDCSDMVRLITYFGKGFRQDKFVDF